MNRLSGGGLASQDVPMGVVYLCPEGQITFSDSAESPEKIGFCVCVAEVYEV